MVWPIPCLINMFTALKGSQFYFYPQTPLLYCKIGVYMGIPFFLFLLQNIYCGYSLVHVISVLSKNKKIIKTFLIKFSNFLAAKYFCILHGRDFHVTCSNLHVYYLENMPHQINLFHKVNLGCKGVCITVDKMLNTSLPRPMIEPGFLAC